MDRTKVEFDEDHTYIVCPLCKNPYLHQEKVDVGFRSTEDEGGMVTKVTRNTATTSYEEHNHAAFSNRRDRVTIYFYCEECTDLDNNDKLLKMHIDQHKGVTFVSWVFDKN